MKTILTVENIEKYYGNRSNITKAVDNISFSVDEGEFIGVMGPSGSGKTTLLNCISTIDNVTSGHIYINGKDITKLKKNDLSSFRRKELGFIFQDFNLLDTFSIEDNIPVKLFSFSFALALTIQKVKPSQIGKCIESVAKKLDITDVLQKYPYQMSGGQKQRVASARALITNPSLILADEPTGALDSKSSRMLLDSMERLNIEYNATIMMVTHRVLCAPYSVYKGWKNIQ